MSQGLFGRINQLLTLEGRFTLIQEGFHLACVEVNRANTKPSFTVHISGEYQGKTFYSPKQVKSQLRKWLDTRSIDSSNVQILVQ